MDEWICCARRKLSPPGYVKLTSIDFQFEFGHRYAKALRTMSASNLTRRGESSDAAAHESNVTSNSTVKSKNDDKDVTVAYVSTVPIVLLQVLAPMGLTIFFFLCLPMLLGPRGGAILEQALSRAFRGGIPGFMAAVVQIFSLMWLRTTINYQFKTGTPLCKALRTLWAEGGLGRFYRGLLPAVLLVPLSRFGDSAANAGVLYLFETVGTSVIPVALQTLAASATSTGWRVLLMPLVVLKVKRIIITTGVTFTTDSFVHICYEIIMKIQHHSCNEKHINITNTIIFNPTYVSDPPANSSI